MSDESTLTPTEQSYIDTKGATPLDAPAAHAEAVPAAPAPTAPEPAKAPDEPRTVPLAVFLQTRDEAKEAKRQAAELQAKWEKIEARFNTPEPAPIDPEADPVAALKALHGEFERMKGEGAEQARQRQQAEQAQAMQREFLGRYQSAAAEFQAKAPDFMEAYAHLRRDRADELAAMGFTDPGMRERIMEQEELGVAMQAFQAGRNPAEVMYTLAGRRGYKAKAAEKAEKQPDLATIAAGQKMAGTLSGSGSVTPPDMSLEAVANMSTDEFEAWMSEGKNAKRWEQMKRGLA